jgi:beta-glucosidase
VVQATIHFPRGFLWGTATAAHQVEGNNTRNQWWQWEQAGHTLDKSGLACDWWGGRWKEDMDRAAETGQNAHRFSVEWSRIQPEPDRWDEDALERYRTMVRGMIERGLTPLVTLHHFTDPLWLFERGGWETEAVVPLFEAYVRRVVEALKEYVTTWCTINEPNSYVAGGYVSPFMPPGKSDIRLAARVQANLLRGHAAAYRAVHQLQPEARVGYALHYRPAVAARPGWPPDRWAANIVHKALNLGFPTGILGGVIRSPLGNAQVPEAKGTQDYVGLNYYTVETVAFDLRNRAELFTRHFFPEGSDLSPDKFLVNVPTGLFDSVKWATRTFPNLPILITENGTEDADDGFRRRYLAQHIHQLWHAVNFNWPVKAYYHWSLVDNFEWERGWSQRFGLWGLDLKTQARIRRPSVDLYEAICRENGLSTEMVAKYCPEVLEKEFPG